MTIAIAVTDWRIEGNIPLGFLYLFPMLLAGSVLKRWQIGLRRRLHRADRTVRQLRLVFSGRHSARHSDLCGVRLHGLFVYEVGPHAARLIGAMPKSS